MVAAEITKLRTLPAALLTMLITVVAGPGLAAATPDAGVSWLIPYLQAGTIVLGVVAGGSEYQGRQYATSLTTVPARWKFLSAKVLAYLVLAGFSGAFAVAGAYAVVWLRTPAAAGVEGWWQPVGMVSYLVLIGLLGLLLAVVLRGVLAALVVMLCLVWVAPPLLGSQMSKWLPDQAGRWLMHTDSAAQGWLLLLAWVAVAALAAGVSLLRRDA